MQFASETIMAVYLVVHMPLELLSFSATTFSELITTLCRLSLRTQALPSQILPGCLARSGRTLTQEKRQSLRSKQRKTSLDISSRWLITKPRRLKRQQTQISLIALNVRRCYLLIADVPMLYLLRTNDAIANDCITSMQTCRFSSIGWLCAHMYQADGEPLILTLCRMCVHPIDKIPSTHKSVQSYTSCQSSSLQHCSKKHRS